MNKVFWIILLSLTTTACGDNSIATKSDVDESVRKSISPNVPIESEEFMNQKIDAMKKIAPLMDSLKTDPQAHGCKKSDGISLGNGSSTYISKSADIWASSEADCIERVNQAVSNKRIEIRAFLAKYAGGFRLKQKIGNLEKVSTETFTVDPTVLWQLNNSL